MPIEIRELVIRAIVEPDQPGPRRLGPERPPALPQGEEARAALVQDCVEQVLRILRREGER